MSCFVFVHLSGNIWNCSKKWVSWIEYLYFLSLNIYKIETDSANSSFALPAGKRRKRINIIESSSSEAEPDASESGSDEESGSGMSVEESELALTAKKPTTTRSGKSQVSVKKSSKSDEESASSMSDDDSGSSVSKEYSVSSKSGEDFESADEVFEDTVGDPSFFEPGNFENTKLMANKTSRTVRFCFKFCI